MRVLCVAAGCDEFDRRAGAAQAEPSPRSPPIGQTLVAKSTTASGLPIVYAQRVERGPEIDGDVLGEAAWMAASPQTGFRQNTPDEGEPASERTEVRILYNRRRRSISAWSASSPTRRRSSSRTRAARLVAGRDRQLPDRARHLPGSAERIRVRDQPAGLEYDGLAHQRGRGQRRHRRRPGRAVRKPAAARSGGGFNLNLGRRLAGGHRGQRRRLDRRVRHPVPDSAIRVGRRADVGRQLPAQHPGTATSSRTGRRCPRQFNLNRLSLAGELHGLEFRPRGTSS